MSDMPTALLTPALLIELHLKCLKVVKHSTSGLELVFANSLEK